MASRMTGVELATDARRYQKLKVFIASSYARSMADDIRDIAGLDLLDKPPRKSERVV